MSHQEEHEQDLYGPDNAVYMSTPLTWDVPPPILSDWHTGSGGSGDARNRNHGGPAGKRGGISFVKAQTAPEAADLEVRMVAEPEPEYDSTPRENDKDKVDEQMGMSNVSSIAMRMMKKSGFEAGSGLGRDGTGISSAIEVTERADRVGLGFATGEPSFEQRKHTVDLNREYPVTQEPQFLTTKKKTADGVRIKPKLDFDDGELHYEVEENNRDYDWDMFCSRDLVERTFANKAKFDSVERRQFLDARNRSNPYEKIKKAIFINRAAVKMANLDQMFQLTEPPMFGQAEPGTAAEVEKMGLTFADICSGPGGFTEYILWRKSSSRGFGFTLRGDTDFNLVNFTKYSEDGKELLPAQRFIPLYGKHNDGDILKWDNMTDFAAKVLASPGAGTEQGVDLVTGDGGISVEEEHNYQEDHLKQLVLCQFLTALLVLKKHGTFCCKVFATHTPFTIGLIWMFRKLFRQTCIIKPYTSRPANSERYVVFQYLRKHRPENAIAHLKALNDELNQLALENSFDTVPRDDVIWSVPKNLLLEDSDFVEYVKASNVLLAQQQVDALEELFMYIEDRTLQPVDQGIIANQCLALWRVPLNMTAPRLKPHQPKPQYGEFYGDMRSAKMTKQEQADDQRRRAVEKTEAYRSVYRSEWKRGEGQGGSGEEGRNHIPTGTLAAHIPARVLTLQKPGMPAESASAQAQAQSSSLNLKLGVDAEAKKKMKKKKKGKADAELLAFPFIHLLPKTGNYVPLSEWAQK